MKEDGMTLLEVLVSFFLLLILLAGGVTFFQVILSLENNVTRDWNMEQNLSFARKQIIEDLRRAEGVVKIINGGKLLRFTFRDAANSHRIDYYRQESKQQLIRDDNGSSAPLTEGIVTSLSFKKENGRLVTVEIISQGKIVHFKAYLKNGWLE